MTENFALIDVSCLTYEKARDFRILVTCNQLVVDDHYAGVLG